MRCNTGTSDKTSKCSEIDHVGKEVRKRTGKSDMVGQSAWVRLVMQVRVVRE